MKSTSQTINEKWTTGKGSEIDLTVTVNGYDYGFDTNYALTINGKDVEVDSSSKSTLVVRMNKQLARLPLSDEITSKIKDMIQAAKNDSKTRTAEANEYEAAAIKSDRGY